MVTLSQKDIDQVAGIIGSVLAFLDADAAHGPTSAHADRAKARMRAAVAYFNGPSNDDHVEPAIAAMAGAGYVAAASSVGASLVVIHGGLARR